jgi:uncharacterized membrane protein (Fun14 family)
MVNITELGMGFGSGGVVGFGLGFLARKAWQLALKVFAALVAFQLAFMYWLESKGIATFDWDALFAATGDAADTAMGVVGTIFSYIEPLFNAFISVLPVGGGLIVGATAGWYLGK